MPALDQNEFDRWVADDRLFKQRVLDHMDSVSTLHLATEGRLSKLESGQDECTREATKRSAWISSIVSAIISGVLGGVWGNGR
jgi:hypothetical protein